MNNKLEQIKEQRKEILQKVSENIKNNKSNLCENIDDVLNVISLDEQNVKKYEAIVKAKAIIAELIEQIVNCKTPEEISKVRNRINYYINKIKTELKNRNFTDEQINLYSEKVSAVRGDIAKYIRCLKRENNLKELEKLSKYKKLNSEQKERMKKLLKNEKSFNRRYLNNSEVKKLSIQDAEKIVRERWNKAEYLKPAICDYLFINSANVDEMNEKLIELAQMSELKFNKFVSENSEIQENIRKRKENSKTKTELKLPNVSMFLKKKDVQLEKISTEYIEQSSEMTIDKAATILRERCAKIEYLESAFEHWFLTNNFVDEKIDTIIIDLAKLSEKEFNNFVNSNYEIQKRINEEKFTKKLWELPEEETNAFYSWLFRKESTLETSNEDMNKVLMMSDSEFSSFIKSLMNPKKTDEIELSSCPIRIIDNSPLTFNGDAAMIEKMKHSPVTQNDKEQPYTPEVFEPTEAGRPITIIDGDSDLLYIDDNVEFINPLYIGDTGKKDSCSQKFTLKLDKSNSQSGIMLCESEDLIQTLNEKVTTHKKQYKILNTYKYGNSIVKNIKFFIQNIPVYLVNKCRIDNMEVAYSRYYHGVDLGGYIRYSKKRNSILYGLRSALSKSYLNAKENQYLNNHEMCANWLIEYCKSIDGNSILNQYSLAK